MSRRGIFVAVGALVLLPSLPAQALTGTITGTVVNAGGRPVPYACVHLAADRYDYNPYGDTQTDERGRFRFGFLPDRPYKVFVEPCWFGFENSFGPEWYGDAYTFYEGEPVHAGPLETVDLEIVVGPGAILAGTVTEIASGLALEHVCVSVSPATFDDPFFSDPWMVRFGQFPTTTDDQGAYTVFNLMPGDYRVAFSWCGSRADPGYVTDALVDAGADHVSLAEGRNDGDKALMRAGGIRGIVTGAAPELEGQSTCVQATGSAETVHSTGVTVGSSYRIDALPPGEYLLAAGGCENFDRVWYPDAIDRAAAEPIEVVPGAWAHGIDVSVTHCLRPGDRDADGLDDCAELEHATDDWRADTDGDGLTDGDEVNIYRSHPLIEDTDGDFYGDGFEVLGGPCVAGDFEGGSDPNDPASTPRTASLDAPIDMIPNPGITVCNRRSADAELDRDAAIAGVPAAG